MAFPYRRINETLVKWATNTPSILDFTVENVIFAVGLSDSDYENVYRYLMSKDGTELIAKKILLCPNNHKCDEFLLNEPVDDDYFDCHCGKTDFEPENFLLAFSFSDEFKDDALRESDFRDVSVKKKKNYRLDLQMV
ncbi:hypothetical protein [Sporosarcina sp. A2]|uniref:hypothetical protein n=1 Tax=Sporosarcina sp. A2 TaxID=3393449 RepID=UPI003D7BA405